ncbi:hypothetical protein PYK79_50030 [Streptomyces sp. ID05-04B]|uniref:zinc finger domain-containing protein n=1 Tax=Streptomyces sp. ID05-04B TaxID=3028661 RepID=UPI0029C48BEA|nr:hypothetical protein [Streptomyces sp. ID05-04B]MDX5569820.1 hypothetical protein [Streptomyces sp. ID05-04B]
MSAAAALAAPRHPRGGAGRAAAPRVLPRRPARRATQTVDIPERVYRGSHYSDVFIKVWSKTAALDLDGNIEHCNAHVDELARFAGISVRDYERGLAEGRTPGPDGGEPEFATRRMTRSGGTGRTAIRSVRAVTTAERSVRVPVAMCDALTPRQLRAALLAAHAEADGHVFTAAELAGELFHHHGDSKGKPLTDRTARRILKDLEASGWIGVGHRAGHQGRNTVTVHRHPLHAAPLTDPAEPAPTADTAPATAAPTEPPCADIHGGSGRDIHGGSLAIKEYSGVVTDGMAQGVVGIRRRRPTGSSAPAPADNPTGSVPDTFGSGRSVLRTETTGPAAVVLGPGLSSQEWAAVWAVLAPVVHTLTDLSSWEWTRTVREIRHQLADGTSVERLTDRIARRYASTETIRSLGRWLLGVALVRHGCTDPRCESGVIWSGRDDHEAGADCRTCAYARETAAAQAQRMRDLEASEQRAAARRGAQPLEDTAAEGFAPRPVQPAPPAALPLPEKATYRQRGLAPDGEIRAAVQAFGPAYALHVYGALRTLPLLDEDDKRAAQAAVDAAQAAAPVGPGYAYMPGQVRAALGARRAAAGDLAAACPDCRAQAGQPCTSPRGRRRATPHTARPSAAEMRDEET